VLPRHDPVKVVIKNGNNKRRNKNALANKAPTNIDESLEIVFRDKRQKVGFPKQSVFEGVAAVEKMSLKS
jgi:hypothetical protein